jgi:molybdenum cofactor cytidylyltransferase
MKRHAERAAGILLAAGASTRMGKTKQLLPIDGSTLLERILSEALKSHLDRVVLVLGHQAEEIRKALGYTLKHAKLVVVENIQYEQSISSSIIVGLSAIEETHDHVMILLGDMPHIDTALINLLLHQYLASRLPLGAVTIKAKRSHPVIFNRSLYFELHKLRGDVGARALFRKYSDRVCLVEPEEFYDDRDIDTPEDYVENA